MQRALEQLLTIQDRDRKIATLEHELKMIPIERADLEERLRASGATYEALKLQGKEIEVARKKLEVEAQAKRDSIAKFRGQQFQTRKNEEFQALTNEIKRYENDIQAIEDQELDFMEQTEKLKVQVAAAEKEFAGAKAQIDARKKDLEAKVSVIEAEAQRLRDERATFATEVDEDLLERYDRLFESKGNAAVVPLEHEVCMGCHMKITTQTAVRAKADKEIVSCEQCGRILYVER